MSSRQAVSSHEAARTYEYVYSYSYMLENERPALIRVQYAGLRVLFGACNVKRLHRFWRLGVQTRFLGHALPQLMVGVPRLMLLFPLLFLV